MMSQNTGAGLVLFLHGLCPDQSSCFAVPCPLCFVVMVVHLPLLLLFFLSEFLADTFATAMLFLLRCALASLPLSLLLLCLLQHMDSLMLPHVRSQVADTIL